MPLLGEKPYHPQVSGESKGKQTISFTGEAFDNKNDYESKLKFYSQTQWTCRSTGKSGLTYEQAIKSEEKSKEKLKSTIPSDLWPVLLRAIHHCTDDEEHLLAHLDKLANGHYLHGESVVMTLPQKGEVHGTIEGVSGGVDSPGNKENTLDMKYTVKLEIDGSPGKAVKNVPQRFIKRAHPIGRSELKCLLHTFASHQIHHPWQLDKDVQLQYAIKDKIASIFCGPNPSPSAPKQQKARKSMKKPSPVVTSPTMVTSAKPTPRILTTAKKSLSSHPAFDEKKGGKDDSTDESSDDDVVFQERRSSGIAPSSARAKKDAKKHKPAPTVTLPAPPMVDLTGEDSNDKWYTPSKASSSSKAAKKKIALATVQVRRQSSQKSENGKKSKPYDIATAFLKKKGDVTLKIGSDEKVKSPVKKLKSPSKSGPTTLTAAQKAHSRVNFFVGRLNELHARPDKRAYNTQAQIVSQTLTLAQIDTFENQIIKADLKRRYELNKEKQMLSEMTEEERKKYLEHKEFEKRELALKKMEEKRREAMIARMKRDDLSLENSVALPEPDTIALPDSVSNDWFGRAAMVTQTIQCFADFLGETTTIDTHSLLSAVSSGKSGFTYVARVLEVLLKPLIQDQVAQDYHCLNMKLVNFVLNEYSAAELARLCLRNKDADGEEGNEDSDNEDEINESFYQDLDSSFISRWEESEFYSLSPTEQLTVLEAIANRLLDSYAVNEWLDSCKAEKSTAWKEYNELQRERNREKFANFKQTVGDQPVIKLDNYFEAPKETEVAEAPVANGEAKGEASEAETDDMRREMINVVKNRRKIQEEERIRRKEEEKLEKEKRRKEEEQQEKIDRIEGARKRWEKAKRNADLSMRVTPLGSDRNHSRYWLFGNAAPGIFVEKGWAAAGSDYSCFIEPEPKQNANNSFPGSMFSFIEVETTAPPITENQWFHYSTPEQFDQLLASLNTKGIRENDLRRNLMEKQNIIRQSLELCQKESSDPAQKPELDLMGEMKSELYKIENQVREGGLGGVADFKEWAEKLEIADTVDKVASCLLETHKFIYPRFMTKMIQPIKVNEDDEQETEPKAKKSGMVSTERWTEAVRQCKSFCRLTLLLHVLDSCIDWDESITVKKCVSCRRTKDDHLLLLCDDCNSAYHTFCLRPPLKRIPSGDWFCPKCSQKRAPKTRSKRGIADSDFDDEQDEEEEEVKPKKKADRGKKRKAVVIVSDDSDNSGDEEETERKKAPRRKKSKTDTDKTATSRVRRSAQNTPSTSGDETNPVSENINRIFAKINSSRLSHALESLPKASASTRSRSDKNLDLNVIKEKLPTYRTMRAFFKDLGALVKTAAEIYQDMPRKLSQVEELEEMILELKTQH